MKVEVRDAGRALSTLSADERLCWILRHWHGLTLEETAAASGISLATAKRRLARAEEGIARWRSEALR